MNVLEKERGNDFDHEQRIESVPGREEQGAADPEVLVDKVLSIGLVAHLLQYVVAEVVDPYQEKDKGRGSRRGGIKRSSVNRTENEREIERENRE